MGEGIGTPVSAPTPGDLITLADAKAYIGVPDLDDDDVLEAVIQAASAAILGFPGMPRITIGQVTEERAFHLSHERTLFLGECTAVTAVTNADGDDLDYTIVGGTRDGEFILWLELPRMTGAVLVTGTWGYDEVPPLLAQAARVTTKVWYERDRAAFLIGLDLNTGFVERPQALPRQVLGLLDLFRRDHVRIR